MKIGINGFEAVVPRFGYDKNGLPNRVGSSAVCFEILRELSKIDKKNEYTVYLPVKPTSDMPKERDKWQYKIVPDTKLWTVFGLNRKLLSEKLDIFFSPTHYGALWISCPQIIAVLDVSYKYFPELFKKSDLLKLNIWGNHSIKTAAKIITISNSSRSDIIKEYHVPESKTAVVYPGIKPDMSVSKMKTSKEILGKHGIEKPYILFVGTIQPRKNIPRLIEAFSKLGEEIDLVIVGRRGWDFEESIAAPEKYGVYDRVHFLESVTDEELPAFYENAEVFVLPSLYEGFGLPVLEAMKYGCPTLVSNISSLPEAGGDAALYFDSEDPDDIKEKIDKVLKDKSLRGKMIKEGYAQIKKFSWEKAARQVLDVFEEVGKKYEA